MQTGSSRAPLQVTIKEPELCHRYIARTVSNIKIGESPDWIKRKLKACGVRPINNIVDITNYVMLELGQPMHAFDINDIDEKHIIVRKAKEGEKFTTLDGEERILDESMLVIADTNKPVALAGIMGGLNSEIKENTTTIVLESAVFNGGNVRLSAKKLGLRTESSSRYEKQLPAENALRVVNRAVQLIEELGIGTADPAIVDVYPTKQEENKIKVDEDKINKLLGTNISKEQMVQILNALGIEINGEYAIIPFFRQDLKNSPDLAEEVLRIYGYDKLEATLLVTRKNNNADKKAKGNK